MELLISYMCEEMSNLKGCIIYKEESIKNKIFSYYIFKYN